jgi:hypothetical protein
VEGQTVETDTATAPDGDVERRVAELEKANEALRQANLALAREQLGKRDAAAAAMLVRLQRAEQLAEGMQHSISWRITAPLRILKPLFEPLSEWWTDKRERARAKLNR